MKKLLFVMNTLTPGNGVAKSFVQLMSYLTPDKYDITILIISKEKGISNEIPPYCKVLFAHRDHSKSFKKQYSRFMNKLHYLLKSKKIRKNKILNKVCKVLDDFELLCYYRYLSSLLSEEKFDISIGFTVSMVSAVATRINAGLKYIYYLDGAIHSYLGEKKYYSASDKIIVDSQNIKQLLSQEKQIDLDKIEVVRNFFDFESIRKKSLCLSGYEELSNYPIFSTVSRIAREKGILEAIKSAKIIKAKYPEFMWIFVGGFEADYYNQCTDLVKKYELQDNIKFVGMQSNPYPFMRICDIYIHPSLIDALPGAIVEAQSLNKVVVSTKTFGGIELVKDNYNGIICDFAPESIANAVDRVLSDATCYNRLKTNAQNFENPNDEIIKIIDRLY